MTNSRHVGLVRPASIPFGFAARQSILPLSNMDVTALFLLKEAENPLDKLQRVLTKLFFN
jgi:hypothetical protein